MALALLGTLTLSSGIAQAQSDPPRPRIGLALGGGAARGIAHVGVLEWLEEHHIPVDVVVGTSMGGLIGGAYASGMSPAEIRTFLELTDWDLIFLGETPYQQRDLRRREDRRMYPMRVEFGLKGGFKLPPGLDNGQQVTFLLQRIALPYYAMTSFDELPTPFRCVATDMEKGEPVVLGSGSLSRAMRATMSLPTAFAPVVIDGRLLADGGILNNVPVDVARAQGADVVIAVNVGSTPHTREQMMSLFGMLGQTLDVAMSDSSRAIARRPTCWCSLPSARLARSIFGEAEEIADLGYKGASEVTALLKYAVDDATWSQWVQARAARRRVDPPVPEFVRIVGVGDKVDTTEIAKGLEQFLGKPLDQEALGQALTRITGDGLYQRGHLRRDSRERARWPARARRREAHRASTAQLRARGEQSRVQGAVVRPGVPRHDVQHAHEELRASPRWLGRHAPGRRGRILSALRPEPLLCRAGDCRRAPHHRVLRQWRVAGRVPGAEGTT